MPTPPPSPPPTQSSDAGQKRKRSTTASLRRKSSNASPKKRVPKPKKGKPAPKLLPYEMTDEQNEAIARADTKRQTSKWGKKPEEPPKLHIAPAVQEHYYNMLTMPSQEQLNLKSDYERGLKKSHEKAFKAGRTIPQLGQQAKQTVAPLVVGSSRQASSSNQATLSLAEQQKIFAEEVGVDLERLMQEDVVFETAPEVWKYKPNRELVHPDKALPYLGTHMRQLHNWYMQACEDKRTMLMAKVREEHFFREDALSLDFPDFWEFYNLGALEKAFLSAYVL
jgi:hypothetical protein